MEKKKSHLFSWRFCIVLTSPITWIWVRWWFHRPTRYCNCKAAYLGTSSPRVRFGRDSSDRRSTIASYLRDVRRASPDGIWDPSRSLNWKFMSLNGKCDCSHFLPINVDIFDLAALLECKLHLNSTRNKEKSIQSRTSAEFPFRYELLFLRS